MRSHPIILQDLAKRLTYRHPAFDGFEKPSADQFIQFTESLNKDDNPLSPKTSWIQTFYLRRSDSAVTPYADHYQVKFNLSFRNLLPHLTVLREFTCRMSVIKEEFEILTQSCNKTLKKLAIYFSSKELPGCLPLLKRLAVLQDLFVFVGPGSDNTPPTEGKPLLPDLCRLALSAYDYDMNYVLNWLNRSTLPKLTTFQMLNSGGLDHAILERFISVHGPNLTTFGCDAMAVREESPMTIVYAHAQKLKHLQGSPTWEMEKVFRGLPASVTSFAFSDFGGGSEHLFYLSLVKHVEKAVRALPSPNMLHTIRFTERLRFVNYDAFTWKSAFKKKPEDAAKWKSFVELANHIQALGITLVDDTGMALTDAILEC